MPLDSPFGKNQDFYRKAKWQRKFAWLPHRCVRSGQIIWLKFGYLGTAVWLGPGPGDPAYEYNWHTTKEHLVWCLKNR